MTLKNEQFIGILGVVGIIYYFFFCKKRVDANVNDLSSGSIGGGGGYGGFAPPTAFIIQTPPPATPLVSTPLAVTNPTILRAMGSTNVGGVNTTSSTGAAAQTSKPVVLDGGIIPASQGGSPVPAPTGGTSSTINAYTQGNVFKPFNGKKFLTIDNLLM